MGATAIMTTEQLAALKEVAEAAQADTPGPWYYANGYVRHRNATDRIGRPKHYAELRKPDGGYGTSKEAQAMQQTRGNHIAAFDPSTCLALLEEVKRLTKAVKDLDHDLNATIKAYEEQEQ
jgi:hypothetical protein